VTRRPRAEAKPEEVALRLAALLPQRSALVGALAVAAHGYVRATDDVDFVSPADPREIRRRLAAGGIESDIRGGDVLEGDLRSVVFGVVGGLRFDVLFPPVPIDWERTTLLPLGRGSLRVVDLDTLLRLKLRAGGPQDLIDVVQLVRRHPARREKALAVAEAYGQRERLATWLADPRIRSPEAVPPLAPKTGGKRPSKRRR
jgi:hypothetical protein